MILKVETECILKNIKDGVPNSPNAMLVVGDNELFGAPPGPGMDKGAYLEALQLLVSQIRPRIVVFCAESWTLTNPKDAEEYNSGRSPYESLEAHPRRSECIFFVIAQKNKNFFGRADRLGENFGPITWSDEGSGRFAELYENLNKGTK